MKRRSQAKGRLGLLAASLAIGPLALALAACGSSAPGVSSASGITSAPTITRAPAESPAPGSTSASTSSTPISSGSSPNLGQFCLTWQLTAPYFSKDYAVLGNDPSYDMSNPAIFFKIASVGIGADLRTAGQWAPAAVSSDMNTVTNYWDAIYADVQYEYSVNRNVTMAQVKAYVRMHPPAQAADVGPALAALSGFLAANCKVNLTS
jgi:hypothetical protein